MTEPVDLVINNARIVDGSGEPSRIGSVTIRGGTIADVSNDEVHGDTSHARRVIDAQGTVLAPGFVDLHSHADFSIGADPHAETQVTQGVTTLLVGNCGSSPFPLREVEPLAQATAFLKPSLDWSWSEAAEFADRVDEARPAVNVALQVGHSALRIAAMGDAAREPTPSELDTMCRLLGSAAEQGVHGFSTGLIYAPGSFAAAAEIDSLVATAAQHDLLYSTHMRNETDEVLDAVAETIAVARRANARLEISHIKAMGPLSHGSVQDALEMMSDAREAGVDVTADVYPYTASSTTLTSRLPGWALDGGNPALLKRLADPDVRAEIERELGSRFHTEIDPDGIVIADLPDGPFSKWTGSSLFEIATATHSSPESVALDILAHHEASVAIVNHAMAESDLLSALQDPLVSVASDGWVMTSTGDGLPHPRSFGTFTRFLGHFVRDLELLTLEEAVRKITALPASRARIADRGTIAPGYVADLVVFDPDTIVDRSTYAEPWRLSEGVSHLLVAGKPVISDGEPTGARPGRVLRRTPRQ